MSQHSHRRSLYHQVVLIHISHFNSRVSVDTRPHCRGRAGTFSTDACSSKTGRERHLTSQGTLVLVFWKAACMRRRPPAAADVACPGRVQGRGPE